MITGAVIGAGKIARTGHFPAYADPSVRQRARIVAAVDPSPGSREQLAREQPGIRCYESADALFAAETLDFIDICSPPNAHAPMIAAALSAGVHILCEKPLTLTTREADGIMAALASRKGVVFLPCHQYRFSPLWRIFKEFRTDGTPALLRWSVYRTRPDPGSPSWNPAWRTDRSISGGGILADTGIHYLYLALWLMGMPQRVTARTLCLSQATGGVEDTALVTLESAGGVTDLLLTWAADRRANSAVLVQQDRSLQYDGTLLIRHEGGSIRTEQAPDASDKSLYVGMYAALLHEFLDRIDRGDGSPDGAQEAYTTIRLLDACYRAAAGGCTVTPEGAP